MVELYHSAWYRVIQAGTLLSRLVQCHLGWYRAAEAGTLSSRLEQYLPGLYSLTQVVTLSPKVALPCSKLSWPLKMDLHHSNLSSVFFTEVIICQLLNQIITVSMAMSMALSLWGYRCPWHCVTETITVSVALWQWDYQCDNGTVLVRLCQWLCFI